MTFGDPEGENQQHKKHGLFSQILIWIPCFLKIIKGWPSVIPKEKTSNTKNTDFVREFLFVTSRIQASLIRGVPNKKPRFTRGFFVAERGGFEPPVRRAYNGFRDRPVRPLRHLSRYGSTKIHKMRNRQLTMFSNCNIFCHRKTAWNHIFDTFRYSYQFLIHATPKLS